MALATRVAFVLSVFSLPQVTTAQTDESPKDDKPKVKIEGRVSAGFEAEEFKNGRSYHDAEIEFETKRKRGTRAVASFRGRSEDPAVVLEDAYIDHEMKEGTSVLGGQMKKRLGLEYAEPDRERLTIRRSPLYQKIEEYAYVGREMTLRYDREVDLKAGSRGYQISAGYSESIDANVTLHVEQPIASGDLSCGAWLLLQSDRIDAGRQFVYAAVFSLWSNGDGNRFQVELMAGVDPFMSEFERTYGDGKPVNYAGAKAQYGIHIGLDDGERLEPVFQTSWLAHDLETSGYDTIQALIGVNYWLSEELRFAANVEGIGTNSPLDLKERAYNESNARLEATYYF